MRWPIRCSYWCLRICEQILDVNNDEGGFVRLHQELSNIPIQTRIIFEGRGCVICSSCSVSSRLAFFGALTGVQARLQSPDARAIVQREEDANFHSKLIVSADLPIYSLDDLKAQAADLTITFGSESSTSGHLMPRHFLLEAGIDPDDDFASVPNFSGSHDLTWKLVESGSFDVGALSEAVWGRAVRDGLVDPDKVREFYTTPAYFNYNWTVQGGLDQVYGDGFTDRLRSALLNLNPEEHPEILDLFNTQRFIDTSNDNYRAIEQVALDQGIIR